MTFPTEFSFTLPRGYTGPDGTIHQEGTMRIATTEDKILSMKDPKVQENPAYYSIILLSRIVTRLGTIDHITPEIIEGLRAADRAYLKEFYREIHGLGPHGI